MKKSDLPSIAQAQILGHLFFCHSPRMSFQTAAPKGRDVYNSPTLLAILKHGWVELNGDDFSHADNDYRSRRMVLTIAGEEALENFLRVTRYKRQDKGKTP